MGCRCGDIARCKSDISTLGSVISKLEELSYYDNSIGNMLSNLASCTEASVSPYNIGELTEKECSLNNSVSKSRNDLISQCASELTNLQNTCSWMESEDSEYHRMIEELQRMQQQQQQQQQQQSNTGEK